jgi:NhaA family Na+:H+ antiporter
VLLLTLAIADDIAALVIIAVLYSGSAGFGEVLVALGGALLGVLVPAKPKAHPTPAPGHTHHPRASPSKRLRDALHPWVAYCIMPLFALANAGVTLQGLGGAATNDAWPIALGIGLGLFLGKPLGILLTTWLAVRLRLGALPPGITWRHVTVLGLLGGIGFTMAMFIANLAFANAANLAVAKLAVLVGSAASAVVGLIVGRLILPEGPRL